MEQIPAENDNKQWVNELHPSFLRHAHRRISRLGMRCNRLCQMGWDINLVAVLHNDTATLAGQCGASGLVEESHHLHQLEQILGRFLKEQRLPSREELEEIQHQCEQLIHLQSNTTTIELEAFDKPIQVQPENDKPETVDEGTMQQASHPSAPGPRFAPPANALLALLPAEGWLEPNSVPSSADLTEEQISPVESNNSASHQPPLIVCCPDNFPNSLLCTLRDTGYPIESCDAWQESLPLAQAKSSPVIFLPAGLKTDPANIKKELQKLNKENPGSPVALLVMGRSTDIAERVQAMRMGAKRYFPVDTAPGEVVGLIRELTGQTTQEKARVLVVDDDEAQVRFAQSILEKAGLDVRAITQPLDTLEVLDQFVPDLILMDLYMPEVNGAELTSLIRENERFLGTPIVFLSGEQDEERQFEALQMGGDDFLEKPVKPKHLITAVTSRIQRSKKLKQRNEVNTQASSPEHARLALIDQLNAMLDEENLEDKAFVYLTLKNRIAFKESLGYQHLDQGMNRLLDFIREQMPEHCSAARFGEFSFALLCPGQSRNHLNDALQTLCKQAGQHPLQPETASNPLLPQLTAGLTWLSDNPRDAARIIAQAEKAAHLAQNQNEIVHEATPLSQPQKVSKDEQQILELIRQSLTDETLQLLFQPLINLNDNTKEQYQTLLRLMTPEQDFIPASRFIPVAEKHGLIPELDRWVMERALDTLVHRMRLNRPIRLFVSQSVQAWLKTEVIDWLSTRLASKQFPASLLCLEFNSNHMSPELTSELKESLAPLRSAGVQICFSRFEQDPEHRKLLETLKPEYTKFDPALLHDSQFMSMLPEMVDWIHQQESKAIIPRVEQAMDAANFWTSGVDFLQGNFIQSPDSKLQFDFQGSAF